MGNTFSCVGVGAVRPFRNSYGDDNCMDLLETESCTRKPTSTIFIKYRRTIEDIKKTTDGIVFIYKEALKFTGKERIDEFTLMLKSLETRFLDLRNSLVKLSKLSVFNVDHSVEKRKEIARDMLLLIEDFRAVIRLVNEGEASILLDVQHRIEHLVQLTSCIFSI